MSNDCSSDDLVITLEYIKNIANQTKTIDISTIFKHRLLINDCILVDRSLWWKYIYRMVILHNTIVGEIKSIVRYLDFSISASSISDLSWLNVYLKLDYENINKNTPDTTYNNDNTYETVSYMQNHGFELGHILDIHEVPCFVNRDTNDKYQHIITIRTMLFSNGALLYAKFIMELKQTICGLLYNLLKCGCVKHCNDNYWWFDCGLEQSLNELVIKLVTDDDIGTYIDECLVDDFNNTTIRDNIEFHKQISELDNGYNNVSVHDVVDNIYEDYEEIWGVKYLDPVYWINQCDSIQHISDFETQNRNQIIGDESIGFGCIKNKLITATSKTQNTEQIDRYNRKCCICLENIKQNIVLIPCGHTLFCEVCVKKIRICSICKVPIKTTQKIYL